jgi:hypothetical protein
MHVSINQSRRCGLSAQINAVGGRTDPCFDVRITADCSNAPPTDGNGFGDRIICVNGQDIAVNEYPISEIFTCKGRCGDEGSKKNQGDYVLHIHSTQNTPAATGRQTGAVMSITSVKIGSVQDFELPSILDTQVFYGAPGKIGGH